MDYHNYNIEDFLNDQSFVNWVIEQGNDTLNPWDDYLTKYPEKREEFQVAVGMVLNVMPRDVDHSEIDKQTKHIWSVLEKKLEHKKAPISKMIHLPVWVYGQWAQIAATLLIVTGLSFIIYSNVDDFSQDTQTELKKVIKSNPAGRKSTIILSDKTRVDLNAESSIEYLINFDSNKREVSLIGEAFFDVERDESRPFIIKVNGIDVKVLGTSFNIKAYPGDNHIEVAVLTGNVEVTDRIQGNAVSLVKNEVANYDYSTHGLTMELIQDPELVFAWKEQRLVFKNQDLESLMKVLSRWYGVDIDYQGVTNVKKEVTGTYQNPSLGEVMMGLSHNYDFEYEINGKQVRIYN